DRRRIRRESSDQACHATAACCRSAASGECAPAVRRDFVGHVAPLILGVDFTCAPRRAKAITVAFAKWSRDALVIDSFARLTDFVSFERLLAEPGPWIGGFDFPFGMPAELVRDLGWPGEWGALVAHCEAMTRLEFRAALDAYRTSRPVGNKYAHRATDGP